jgi:hypothetical protein
MLDALSSSLCHVLLMLRPQLWPIVHSDVAGPSSHVPANTDRLDSSATLRIVLRCEVAHWHEQRQLCVYVAWLGSRWPASRFRLKGLRATYPSSCYWQVHLETLGLREHGVESYAVIL